MTQEDIKYLKSLGLTPDDVQEDNYMQSGGFTIDPKTKLKIYNPPSGNLTDDELNYLGHKWRGNYSAEYLPPGGLYNVNGQSMQELSPSQREQVSKYMKNTSFVTDFWQSMPNMFSDHRGKNNRLMQNGGMQQSNQQPDEQEQLMQIIQIYSQLANVKPEELIKQIKSAKPQDQQKMIQQMVMQIQEYKKQNSGQNEQEIVNNPQEEMQEPQMMYGGKTKKKMYESGGLQNYFKSKNGNVEAEDDEHVLTPNGKSFELKGKTHAEGGIDLDLPGNSIIFSEKIKAPKEIIAQVLNKELKDLNKSEKKLSFADLAKKYSTEKDFKELKGSEDVYKQKSIALNIQRKVPKLAEVFESQERYKFGLGMENDYEQIMMSKQENQFPEENQIAEYGGKIYAQNGLKLNEYGNPSNEVNNEGKYINGVWYPYNNQNKKNTPRYIGLEDNYPLISKNPFLENLNQINKQSKNKSGYYGNVDNINPLKFALPNYNYTEPINYKNWQNEYNNQYTNGRNILSTINPQLAEQLPLDIFNNNDSYTLNDIDNKFGNFTATRNRYGIPLDTYQGQDINLNDIDENFYKNYIQPYYPNLTLDQIKNSSNFYFKGNDTPEVVITAKRNNNVDTTPPSTTTATVTDKTDEKIDTSPSYTPNKRTGKILDFNPILNANKMQFINNMAANVNDINRPILYRRPPIQSLDRALDFPKINDIAFNKSLSNRQYQINNQGLDNLTEQALYSNDYAKNLDNLYGNIPKTSDYYNVQHNNNKNTVYNNQLGQYNYDVAALSQYAKENDIVDAGIYKNTKENYENINRMIGNDAEFQQTYNNFLAYNKGAVDLGNNRINYTPDDDEVNRINNKSMCIQLQMSKGLSINDAVAACNSIFS